MADAITKLPRLRTDCVNVVPIDFDWSEGYGERWEIVYPDFDSWTVRRCSAYLEDEGYSGDAPSVNPFDMNREELCEALEENGFECGAFHADSDLLEKFLEYMDDGTIDGAEEWRDMAREQMQDSDALAPMMNHAYRLGKSYDASAIGSLPACTVVTIDDDPYLALTGGGMDLSHEIVTSYVKLGFLPPAHFCDDLPQYAGEPPDPTVMAYCRESLRIQLLRAQMGLERFEQRWKDVPFPATDFDD